MAMALPVITSDITPLNQIVRHDHEGLLVAEGDVTALADAMIALIHDPARAQRLGQAGRARVVAQYSWQQHCAELERIMQAMTTRQC
jgi:glycosyltransferase involved in cell wall biosynthesis